MNIDPLAESFYDDSPFTYALNNPVYFIDPTGMSSEPNDVEETDCSVKGSCVQLAEVVVTAKSNRSDFFGYNFGSTNLRNNSNALHRAIYTTPATKDIDNSINEVVKMANPAFAAVLIADDLSKGKEVEKEEYLAVIPAFRIFKVTKYGTIIQKTIPVVQKSLTKAGNIIGKGGYTAAGRALMKHSSRIDSKFPKAIGSREAINSQGEAVLQGIISHPNVEKVIRHHAKFGEIMELRVPGGQGVRFTSDAKKLIGFLE